MAGNSGKQRGRGKPFVKGQSGNPSGRPAVAKAFKDRMREWMDRDTDGGAARLIAMAEDAEHRDQFAALQLIAAYAYGKPTAAVEVSGPDGGAITLRTQGMSEAEKAALVQRVAGELAQRGDGARPGG